MNVAMPNDIRSRIRVVDTEYPGSALRLHTNKESNLLALMQDEIEKIERMIRMQNNEKQYGRT